MFFNILDIDGSAQLLLILSLWRLLWYDCCILNDVGFLARPLKYLRAIRLDSWRSRYATLEPEAFPVVGLALRAHMLSKLLCNGASKRRTEIVLAIYDYSWCLVNYILHKILPPIRPPLPICNPTYLIIIFVLI